VPLLLVLGCSDGVSDPDVDAAPATLGASRFNAASAGIIRGHVVWNGDLPAVPALKVGQIALYGPPFDKMHVRDNPNAPIISLGSRGVADAVVFLDGIDPENARPWNHGHVRIEQREGRLHVLQEGVDSRLGFVRPGDDVGLVSKDSFPHALRASGAAFFTLAFPDPDQPLMRRFERKGVVELSSGLGYYWIRGYLFVDKNPYYVRTDNKGRFMLRDVPPGRYRLVCWHPSWVEECHERDPETSLISRYYFRQPVQQEQQVQVTPHGTIAVRFQLDTDLFERRDQSRGH
jgi:hypothetical protein